MLQFATLPSLCAQATAHTNRSQVSGAPQKVKAIHSHKARRAPTDCFTQWHHNSSRHAIDLICVCVCVCLQGLCGAMALASYDQLQLATFGKVYQGD